MYGYKLVGEGFLEVNERKPVGEEVVARQGFSVLEFRKIAGKKPVYDTLDDAMGLGIDEEIVIA